MAVGGDRAGHQKSFTFSKTEQEGKKQNKDARTKKKKEKKKKRRKRATQRPQLPPGTPGAANELSCPAQRVGEEDGAGPLQGLL